MKQLHAICMDDKSGRWFLGVDRSNGDAVWIHQKFVATGADQFGLLSYNKFEDAEVSAAKIGDGAYALTINY